MGMNSSIRARVGKAGLLTATALLMAGCGLLSGPEPAPEQTPTAPATEVPRDEDGTPLPTEGAPYAPHVTGQLHADPSTAMLQAIGCFYAYDTTTQEDPRDTYLACEDISTEVLVDEITESWMIEPPTPYEVDWEGYREAGLRTASVTVDLISSGHDHGEDPNEPAAEEDDTRIEVDHAAEAEAEAGRAADVTAYREARIILELTADGSQVAQTLDFGALIILERDTPDDPWKVDVLSYLDDSGYEWDPA